jgi:predicted transcriptional regulator
MSSEQPLRLELLSLTAEIVAAHTSNNAVGAADLPGVIQQIFVTLSNLSADGVQGGLTTRPKPAVPINKSISDDFIVCLEDGKKLQMLKRHLKTVYNLTVEQYRERWGLPSDYPVVAPNYAKRRSEIAKSSGLGMSRHRRKKLKVVETVENIPQVA